MRIPIQRRLLYSHFLAVVLVSGSIGTLFYRAALDSLYESLRVRLQNSAALLSRSIDARELEEIRAPLDIERPAYRRYLELLREYQSSNEDIAFIYVMRLQGEEVIFVLDSDASSEQALPGTVFYEEAPRLRAGFSSVAADDEITSDRWGSFLSGYAPLKNGEGRYLVGLDMRADEVDRKLSRLRVAGVGSLGLSIVLAYAFSSFMARRITRPVHLVTTRSREIAAGVLEGEVEVRSGDELEELANAVNTMSLRLRESHERTQGALFELAEARDSLELRVEERTARLAQVNERLTREMGEREKAEEALARAATTDYLTGLTNRRAMLQRLEEETARAQRSGRPFTILLADLDRFKQINDRYGHETGDHALVAIADLLRAMVRKQDLVARWGGEELLVFLPETPLAGGLEVAEKIRAGLADQPHCVLGRELVVTISVGVAEVSGEVSITEAVRAADAALYRAKAAGRNRVESA
jgi:diguanylate cyclase (GGDEF)-like protein